MLESEGKKTLVSAQKNILFGGRRMKIPPSWGMWKSCVSRVLQKFKYGVLADVPGTQPAVGRAEVPALRGHGAYGQLLPNQTVVCSEALSFSFFFFLATPSLGMWKSWARDWTCHSSDPNCCSDNSRSLTCCTTGELLDALSLNTSLIKKLWAFPKVLRRTETNTNCLAVKSKPTRPSRRPQTVSLWEAKRDSNEHRQAVQTERAFRINAVSWLSS